ncbi:MAG: glycosyltransferase [bacterium]|nr:glycosyltransferase [bacterium]
MPYPPVGGGESKFFHLLREVSRFHEVDLLLFPPAPPSQEDIDGLRPHAHSIRIEPFRHRPDCRDILRSLVSPFPLPLSFFRNSPIRGAVKRALGDEKYDLLHVEGCFLGYSVVGLRTPPRLIVPHDAYYRNYMENLKMAPWRKKPPLAIDFIKFRRIEPRLYGYYDAVGMCTTVEAHAVMKLNPSLHVGVVSNGVDIPAAARQPRAEEFPSLVFSGSFDYPPNEVAALRLLTRIAPPLRMKWPGLRIFIVGNRPTRRMEWAAAGNPGNVVTGRVESVSEWIARGSVYCSPLSYGVGFKNKVPEAWAAGKPLVATPKTMEGIEFIPGRDALVAETDADLVRACAMLLEDANLRGKIGESGRKRVDERYNWPFLAKYLLELYDYVAARPDNTR